MVRVRKAIQGKNLAQACNRVFFGTHANRQRLARAAALPKHAIGTKREGTVVGEVTMVPEPCRCLAILRLPRTMIDGGSH